MASDLSPVGERQIVLIADADVPSRTFYRDCLQHCDYEIIEAADGRDALAKALLREPALVLTELSLGLIDGVALCEELRNDASTRDTPILIVTADPRAGYDYKDLIRHTGANVILRKPVPAEALVAEALRLIHQSHQLRSRSAALHARGAAQVNRSGALLKRLSRTHLRYETANPPESPPDLRCPNCDLPLKFGHSNIGGVSAKHAEQWDYYVCPGSCGTFQFRHRTRKVRHVA